MTRYESSDGVIRFTRRVRICNGTAVLGWTTPHLLQVSGSLHGSHVLMREKHYFKSAGPGVDNQRAPAWKETVKSIATNV